MTSSQESTGIRLLLVDDHAVVLHGLREFFRTQGDLTVVGEAGTGEAALAALEEAEPDVAVLDLRLPDMDGITLCRELRSRLPDLQCLMLSSFAEEDTVVDAMLGGAAGYILKDAPLSEVANAVRRVAKGDPVLDPAVTARVMARLRSHQPGQNPVFLLTEQEQRILDLIAAALTNREIAERLNLAEQTVKNYVSSILAKLGSKRRMHAAAFARDLPRRSRSDD